MLEQANEHAILGTFVCKLCTAYQRRMFLLLLGTFFSTDSAKYKWCTSNRAPILLFIIVNVERGILLG